jgi:hypothetical protein
MGFVTIQALVDQYTVMARTPEAVDIFVPIF